MGLDGISVNQLRITQDNSTTQNVNSSKGFLNENIKAVDGMSEGQRVDPDKHNKQEKRELNKQYVKVSQDDINDEDVENNEEVLKYDLSQTDKYTLKVDESTNTIMIIKKDTQEVVQSLDAQGLSRFVNFMDNAKGTLINRKY